MNEQTHWMDINERFLAAMATRVRLRLQRMAGPALRCTPRADASSESDPEPGWEERLQQVEQEMQQLEQHDPPPALMLLAERLGLTAFECEVLALCAAVELDTRIAGLCAAAQGDGNRPYPTFSLAFSLFDNPDWGALSPHSALRHWRLIEINQPGSQTLSVAALSADERVVNYLKGLNYLDDRITPLIDPVRAEAAERPSEHHALPPSQQQLVDRVIAHISGNRNEERRPVIELRGRDAESKRLIAARASASLGLNLYRMDIRSLPGQTGDFETFSRLWQRESLLLPIALFIDTAADEQHSILLNRLLERNVGTVFLSVKTQIAERSRHRLLIEVNKPSPQEQHDLWAEHLPAAGHETPRRLSEQFSFTRSEIIHLVSGCKNVNGNLKSELWPELWHACRVTARVGMEQLAQRVEAKATWEQLVLPGDQTALLQQIAEQVRCRHRVYEDWGFRQRMNRGMGISALFAGESGTGKTMAAEVIANTLGLDLFRIDLSAVVSKYIGETEKNLRKLFEAAQDSGAIVFFDEADALFGKRSEVKDSHDRYANIEINFLLQQMESYQGLAILASNMKASLDKAFVRRLRFIVDFPFPGREQRLEIWQKIFPPETPVEEKFDFPRLARLNLTGGNIHNVAINAAFLAAQANTPVTLPLALEAARAEFRKLERPVKDSDFSCRPGLEAVL